MYPGTGKGEVPEGHGDTYGSNDLRLTGDFRGARLVGRGYERVPAFTLLEQDIHKTDTSNVRDDDE